MGESLVTKPLGKAPQQKPTEEGAPGRRDGSEPLPLPLPVPVAAVTEIPAVPIEAAPAVPMWVWGADAEYAEDEVPPVERPKEDNTGNAQREERAKVELPDMPEVKKKPPKVRLPTTVGFLFLLREDLNQPQAWESFFGQLGGKGDAYAVVAHSLKPGEVKTKFLKDKLIKKMSGTETGLGRVKTILKMMRQVLKVKNLSSVVLVSESCVPIVRFEELAEEMSIEPAKSWGAKRSWTAMSSEYQKHFEGLKAINGTPFSQENFYHHSPWLALRREHVRMLTENDLTEMFENVTNPHEHYFVSALAHMGVNIATEFAKPGKCVAHVGPGPLAQVPTTFTGKLASLDLATLISSTCMFARKFSKDSDIKKHLGLIVESRGGSEGVEA